MPSVSRLDVKHQEFKTMKNLRIEKLKSLSLAALLMAGAAMAACSSSEDLAEEPQPENPAKKTYTMTVTATKGDDSALARAISATQGDATTRALSLSNDGKALNATWAAGEKVYVYNNTKEEDLGYLEAKTAGATVTLEGELTGTIGEGDELYLGFPQLDEDYTGQDGTLATIASTCDYALGWAEVTGVSDGKITAEDNLSGDATIQFQNQQAIVRFTLLDKADNSDIKATSLIIEAKDADSDDMLIQTYDFASDSKTYGPITITPSATNVIYAALATFDSDESYDYTLTATDGDGNTYTYSKAGVKFEWGKFYSITVKMNRLVDLSECYGIYEARDGDVLTGEKPEGCGVIPDGATVTLRDASINCNGGVPGITCNGDATIILEGSNTVTGSEGEPGISVPEGRTLTIKGSGSLTAEGGTYEFGGNKWGGAGIGGLPEGGNVIIEGGSITAIGGYGAPGIGGSYDSQYISFFGTITIKNTVTSVTATKGADAPYCIGPSKDGSCEMITFGDVDVYTASEWNYYIKYVLEPKGWVNVGGLKVTKTATNVAGDTWTLTPETNN